MSLRSIANNLGLSVTTVSRALAGYADVAEETRRRVKSEADRIGYVPNIVARRLQKGRSDAIGLVAPAEAEALGDGYLQSAFTGAWTRLSETDRDLLIIPSLVEARPDGSGDRMFRRAVDERRVDGFLLLRTLCDDWRIRVLEAAGLPFVVFGARHLDQPAITAVGIDDDDAAHKVLGRLKGFGHVRATLVVPGGGYDFVTWRKKALDRIAASYGIDLDCVEDHFTEAGGSAATERLLGSRAPPTAIVYFSNRMALGGISAFAQSRFVPGRHVSLISYADNNALDYSNPALTAVRAPVYDMVRHAIDLLVARIDGTRAEPTRDWPVTLVERDSDGPPLATPPGGTAPDRRLADQEQI